MSGIESSSEAIDDGGQQQNGQLLNSEKSIPKELRKLSAHNEPGNEDLGVSDNIRRRAPTVTAARAKYDISMDKLRELLDQLADPTRQGVSEPLLRAEFGKVKQQEKECVSSAKDWQRLIQKLVHWRKSMK